MNLFKIKIISVFTIFILCFITHFLYDIFKNDFFAIFFPVNESIWEHMKMIYTTIILGSIIDLILLINFNIKFNNFLLSVFVSSILSIPIYLFLYIPFFNKEHNLFITLLILFITIMIISFISYIILKTKYIKYLNYISLFLIIIGFIIMGYLTYHPIKNPLFLDKEKNKYGINSYVI